MPLFLCPKGGYTMGKERNRALTPEEVEVRIDAVSPGSITLVVYITARSAMNLLDELYGAGGWSKKLRVFPAKENGYFAVCSIDAVIDENTVITREDVGEDQRSSKAAASDALKRAATNLVPSLRALYTVPTIRVSAEKLGIALQTDPMDRKGRIEELKGAIRFRKFKVLSIGFGSSAAGEFVKFLQIVDEETGNIVHEFTSSTREYRSACSPALIELKSLMNEAHITEEQMLEFYDVSSLEDIVENKTVYEDARLNLEGRADKCRQKAKAKKSKAPTDINAQLGGKEA